MKKLSIVLILILFGCAGVEPRTDKFIEHEVKPGFNVVYTFLPRFQKLNVFGRTTVEHEISNHSRFPLTVKIEKHIFGFDEAGKVILKKKVDWIGCENNFKLYSGQNRKVRYTIKPPDKKKSYPICLIVSVYTPGREGKVNFGLQWGNYILVEGRRRFKKSIKIHSLEQRKNDLILTVENTSEEPYILRGKIGEDIFLGERVLLRGSRSIVLKNKEAKGQVSVILDIGAKCRIGKKFYVY